MFPSERTSTLTQRALGVMRLTRSFLMLEEEEHVDWEVDPNEPAPVTHPHRVPLRGGFAARRPGEPGPSQNPCLCPIRRTRVLPAVRGARGAGELSSRA